MKKAITVFLALTMLLTLSVTVFADESSDHGVPSDHSVGIAADFDSRDDVVNNTYYVTLSWNRTGVLTYHSDKDTYTWNTETLEYDKTTENGSWELSAAAVEITVVNRSDKSVTAVLGDPGFITGLTVDGSFDTQTLNVGTAAPANHADLKVDGAAAPEATAIYSFQSVDGAWDGVGDIGIITVSLSANP